jgi:membrane protein YdbS with pleckstrin-like domain
MPQARPSHKPPWKTFLQVAAILVLPVFLVLKLTSTIGWSWWWVMAPVWITVLAGAGVAAVVALGYTLIKWILLATAWLGFRRTLLPELALADPMIRNRIEAERPTVPAVGDDDPFGGA